MQNSNSPAFPAAKLPIDEPSGYGGLTKREYTAIMAMQGMLSALTKFRIENGIEKIIVYSPKDIAEISCLYADGILSELEKPQSPPK